MISSSTCLTRTETSRRQTPTLTPRPPKECAQPSWMAEEMTEEASLCGNGKAAAALVGVRSTTGFNRLERTQLFGPGQTALGKPNRVCRSKSEGKYSE